MLPTSPPTGSFPVPMSFETAWEMTEVPMMLGVANSRGPASWSQRKATELKGARNIEGDPTGLNLVTGPEELQTEDALLQRMPRPSRHAPDLVDALRAQFIISTVPDDQLVLSSLDLLAKRALVVPRSKRWQEAVSTALLGDWSAPLWSDGHLSPTAIGALKAEARTIHRQLVPVWQRRTRHGRVLSLDAVLGDGISLYDLIAAEADLLPRIAHGVFEDERLNAVLRGLDQVERDIVFAYAEGEGTTWAEAAAFVGSPNPEAIGERVRRKTKRLAAEQRRRLAQRNFYRVVHSSRRMSPEVTRIDASA
ncbi:hypothetical protein [Streptomyces similanensis]|uniref:Sigma-70 family RNA polymerase sigma factor n=1 Tax=Streptomyces similanensis TaxID=1274988 RepID=A0ABP9JXM0_9ACTN